MLIGGPGNDVIRARDRYRRPVQAGTDTGVRGVDRVHCGRGRDKALLDAAMPRIIEKARLIPMEFLAYVLAMQKVTLT